MNEEQNDNKTVDQNVYGVEVEQPQKKLKIALIIFVILLLIGLAIYLIFFTNIFFKKEAKEAIDTGKKIEDIEVRVRNYPSLRSDDDDLDNDGVLNVDEEKLGTSNSEFDTDWDGISDKLEIEVYKTDPTKTDTDGDGFSDGYEILNGYNPLGAGKL